MNWANRDRETNTAVLASCPHHLLPVVWPDRGETEQDLCVRALKGPFTHNKNSFFPFLVLNYFFPKRISSWLLARYPGNHSLFLMQQD